MRVIICGGRDYTLTDNDMAWLDTLGITHVRHGGARGADQHADRWATSRGIPVSTFPADWRAGHSAGPRRNAEMLDDLLRDGWRHEPPGRLVVIAFPGGRGTADMVRQATLAGVPVLHAP